MTITKKNLLCVIVWIVISFFPHEIGHVIALWMLGIPAYVEFAIISFGPVLRVKWMYPPTELSDIWFAAFFGPFFAGIIMMAVGRIKSEAYIAGEIQLLWAPFELMSVILLLGRSNVLELYGLLFIMVIIPLLLVLGWGFDKVNECNK